MFKGIKSALQSCFTKEFVLVVLIFGVLAWGLLSYSDQKVTYLDAMQDGSGDKQEVDLVKDKVVSKEVSPSAAPDAGYALKEVANPTDLLPQDKNSQWQGYITRTEGERDSNQLLYVIAQVSSSDLFNQTRKPLLPGSFVEAEIQGAPIEGIKVIPRQAEQANNKVWSIAPDNRIQSKQVTVLYRGKHYIYIKAGIEEHDRIVTGNFHIMAEGLEVEPMSENLASLFGVEK